MCKERVKCRYIISIAQIGENVEMAVRAGTVEAFSSDTVTGLRLPASAALSLASCWPRPQQLLPVSAAGGGRRRCSRRERHWRVGQAHAGRVKLNLYRKQQYPATKASSSLTRNMVPQLLPSVAGHYFLRYIKLSAVSLELSGLPMAPPLGELSRLRRD